MDNIVDLLKDEPGSKVTLGHRWLVWDGIEWVVWERLPYQKTIRVIVSTKDMELAIKSMVLSDLEGDK